ncbi:CPBP family intramembrane glutamic endopeptidase [Sphingomonas radiodurans]|uniref:CPBP family intramembrane glutamic endopeptidase n=1 Tax=Sphingomonas radiodurans TaxID=2890321 RepID=UPI001E30FF39|nr:CPBP family intramembrane glutamic endopeptidase [Sphingomonas radiodurans]WBH17640.1 CPBP family intramembrane metalloprotease [Sphingomonas radiodurans]
MIGLAAALLVAAIGMVAHGWWRGRSLAALVAERLRGPFASRRRNATAWATGIFVMYGATSLIALALLGRLDAVLALPSELRAAAARIGVAPIGFDELWIYAGAIGGGFALGALLVALSAWRGWRLLGPSYRSPAIVRTRPEIAAALLLSAAAGVGEELFFRLLVPLLAAIVSGSGTIGCVVGWGLFTLAHQYQGRGGMLAVGVVGAVLGWLYLATGLLWVVALLHALVDVNALVVRPWVERRLRR